MIIRNHKGFTLIELILYISVLAIVMLTVSSFLYLILQSRVKNQTIAEVDGAGVQIMQMTTQTIRNSTQVNSPANGATGAVLSVNTPTTANNPTVFDVSSGVFRIKEGAGAAIPLTNSRVVVSNLSFQNLLNSIKIQFTISGVNPNNLTEYNYSQTFYGTANIR